jgi:hypothetical protein
MTLEEEQATRTFLPQTRKTRPNEEVTKKKKGKHHGCPCCFPAAGSLPRPVPVVASLGRWRIAWTRRPANTAFLSQTPIQLANIFSITIERYPNMAASHLRRRLA